MAYYSDSLIEEVLAQNDIVEVVSEYVTLKKSGRNYMGLCPFHREKTPSFCVSIDKQIFKCFGCGVGGNVISFIAKVEKLEFWESVEYLAERAHIDLSKYISASSKISKQEQVQKRDLRETIYNLNKDAAIYYHNALLQKLKEDKNPVAEYIKKRRLDSKTITKFGLGYGRANEMPINQHLIQKGYTEEQILESGILVKTQRQTLYDRFDFRVIFPIFDVRNRVIGFGGRVLDDSKPKYVNSPENVVYSKGKNLYALNFAKNEKLQNIIMVEGYMDAVSLHKYGVNNTVASLGTALTEGQARLLKKYSDNIIIGYDQDGAGQAATLRGLDILVDKGLNVKVLKLDKSDVKDPDEYINKYGVKLFQNCVKNSISLVEFKISRLESTLDLNDLDQKIKFLTETANILAKIDNNIERDIYLDKITKKYNIAKGPIQNEIDKRLNNKVTEIVIDSNQVIKKAQKNSDVKKRQQQYIIALILTKDSKIQKKVFSDILADDIEDQVIKKIYSRILDLNQEENINKIDILSKFSDEDQIKELTDIMYIDLSSIDKEKLLVEVIKNLRKAKYIKRRSQIIERMGQNITKDEQEVLQFELNQIILELAKLK